MKEWKIERKKNRNDNVIKWIIMWTGDNIGYEGARMISDALKTNTTLTILDLGSDNKEMNE